MYGHTDKETPGCDCMRCMHARWNAENAKKHAHAVFEDRAQQLSELSHLIIMPEILQGAFNGYVQFALKCGEGLGKSASVPNN